MRFERVHQGIPAVNPNTARAPVVICRRDPLDQRPRGFDLTISVKLTSVNIRLQTKHDHTAKPATESTTDYKDTCE